MGNQDVAHHSPAIATFVCYIHKYAFKKIKTFVTNLAVTVW